MRFTEAYQSKQHEEEWLNELFAKWITSYCMTGKCFR
jgi:hypothetical protein